MKKLTNNVLFVLITSIFLVTSLSAAKEETYTITGFIVDAGGETVSAADVVLLDSDGKKVKKTSTGKRGKSKGSFEFKKIKAGDYTVQASKKNAGSGSLELALTDSDEEIRLTIASESEAVAGEPTATGETGTVDRMPQEDFVMSELNFEIKKLTAEMDHLGGQIRDLQARSEMWMNPLSIYSKEIIMDNGSSLFGKVVYQDEEILKVETLVGYAVIDRSGVVRIVENIIAEEEPEYIPEQIRETYSPPPMPKLAEPRYVSGKPAERLPSRVRTANIVLVGNISEKKDRSNNTTFSGQTKNIGGRRADFVKVNFVFRKNWSGETQTLTTFVGGSYHTFDSGITTDSSLLPGASGNFEMVIPADFGSFIGYSYTIDWEEYE